MQRNTRSQAPLSARTDLKNAIAKLDATRAELAPYAALRAWRADASRRYVKPRRSERPKHQP